MILFGLFNTVFERLIAMKELEGNSFLKNLATCRKLPLRPEGELFLGVYAHLNLCYPSLTEEFIMWMTRLSPVLASVLLPPS